MIEVLIPVFLFFLGGGVGSFVTVAVQRVRKPKTLMGQSKCDKCGRTLGWLEMVPIISWLILRGRCQKCCRKIGIEPLLIELATACFFTISYTMWPYGAIVGPVDIVLFILWLVILSGLIFLLIYDTRYQILPNFAIYPIIAISMIFWLVVSVDNEQIFYSKHWLELLLSMIPVAGVYGLIYLISRGKLIGGGDVKLGIVIGFLLSWVGSLAVLFLANILGLIIYLSIPRALRNVRIPFGPMLIVMLITIFLCGGIFRGFL